MPPGGVGQPVRDEAPQPRVEGQRPVAHVLVQARRRFGHGLLDDVGGVHPCRQATVDADRDHASEFGPVPLQQLAAGCSVAAAHGFQQLFGVRTGSCRHARRSPNTLAAKQGAGVTQKQRGTSDSRKYSADCYLCRRNFEKSGLVQERVTGRSVRLGAPDRPSSARGTSS